MGSNAGIGLSFCVFLFLFALFLFYFHKKTSVFQFISTMCLFTAMIRVISSVHMTWCKDKYCIIKEESASETRL